MICFCATDVITLMHPPLSFIQSIVLYEGSLLHMGIVYMNIFEASFGWLLRLKMYSVTTLNGSPLAQLKYQIICQCVNMLSNPPTRL